MGAPREQRRLRAPRTAADQREDKQHRSAEEGAMEAYSGISPVASTAYGAGVTLCRCAARGGDEPLTGPVSAGRTWRPAHSRRAVARCRDRPAGTRRDGSARKAERLPFEARRALRPEARCSGRRGSSSAHQMLESRASSAAQGTGHARAVRSRPLVACILFWVRNKR